MSSRSVIIVLSVALVAVQAVDYAYRTVLTKGFEGPSPVTKGIRARIPANQCDASLDFPRDYKCTSPQGVTHPPLVLRVEVLDNNGPAMIRIDGERTGVRVYRVTDHASHCLTSAQVQLYLAC